MPSLVDLVINAEDIETDILEYLEIDDVNEIMTHEINNFVLDLAGIDRQLTADGPINHRNFLNRLDKESLPVINFFGKPTDKHAKCEEIIKMLAIYFYSTPDHYATVEFLTLMAQCRLNVLKNAVGYVTTIILETLADELGTDYVQHYSLVCGKLVGVLTKFVENASLAGILFLVPRLMRLLEANPSIVAVRNFLPGLYSELLRTDHPKTTCQLLSTLTKLALEEELEDQWRSLVVEYLADFMANELEDFLWSPASEVVKCAFNLLVEVQRGYGEESIMTENSTVRTYRKLFDTVHEIKTMAFTFMQATTTGPIVVKFIRFLLATHMITDADIAKVYDFVWCFEELRNLMELQQILTADNLTAPEQMLLIRIIAYVFGKVSEISREETAQNDESDVVNAELARFITSFPAMLWAAAGNEHVFAGLFKVVDICDAQMFDRNSEDGGEKLIDQILQIISDETSKTHYQMFMTYRLLHKISSKSIDLATRIEQFLREVLTLFVDGFRFEETTVGDKTMGSTIVYPNICFILVHMSALYEWFPLHALIPDGVLDTFHQVVAADLTNNRLATGDTVEKGCLISILARLYWHKYGQSLREGNMPAAKTSVKRIVSFVRWLRMEFIDEGDCDAFLAMQVFAATCEIFTIFSTAVNDRFPRTIPNICEKVGRILDAEFIDAMTTFAARVVFNENIPDTHGYKVRMLGQWNEFQRTYSDFADFCSSTNILEHLVNAGHYQRKIEELVKILLTRDHRLACEAMAFTLHGLPLGAGRFDWIEAFCQELVTVLKKLQDDVNLVSHTVKIIVKYMLNYLVSSPDSDGNEPVEHRFDILNGFHPLVEALNRQDSKLVMVKLHALIGRGEAPSALELMTPALVTFEGLLKKKATK